MKASQKRHRLLIADDHVVVAAGLRKLLEPEFQVLKVVGDGKTLVDESQALRPDLVILDISMPHLNGFEAIRQIRKVQPHIKFIVLSMHTESIYPARAFRFGASGYVVKHADPSELLTAVRKVLKGKMYLTPLVALNQQDVEELPQREYAPPDFSLPPRQREILQLMAAGNSTKEIAAILHLSPRTVEAHRYRMMKALNMKTGAQLIQYAIASHGTSASSYT